MKKGLTLLAVLLTLIGCNSQKKSQTEDDSVNNPKCLVIYYSQTGTTQKVAEELVRMLNADTLRIEAEQPYNGTYAETIERCKKEMGNEELPKLKPINTELEDYDVVFLGYPIWFGTYARPIASLLTEVDFAGKKVVPFCTFGSGGLETSIKDLKQAIPDAQIQTGYGIRNARIDKAPAEVERFLKESGYLTGEVEKLPDFSPQQPVTKEDISLFDMACGDYTYPLGTPVTVGKRQTAQGTDYQFTVQSKDNNDNPIEATIYVTVGNGAKPEFTKVVR